VRQPNGSTLVRLSYGGHRIFEGKRPIEGLPSVYAEAGDRAQTLEIDLVDGLIGLKATLSYTVFDDFDAIARSVRLTNEGSEALTVLRAMSASFDLPTSNYEVLRLCGDWARERGVVRTPAAPGSICLESRRGASSHQMNPFIALVSPGTDEDRGEVFAMSLVYSGNFLAQAEVDRLGGTRLSIGVNPFEFAWRLGPGESFCTPEAVLVHSSRGLGDMSRRYHDLYRSRLCRGAWRDRPRPILVNSWEASYFDVDADKIEALARTASKLGIELCVLDDGWFGKREDDTSSLGDWSVDGRKLPLGLGDLAERVNRQGLGFGLWFEPEMVSPDSELYRAHPDWCLHLPGRPRTESRHQLVLDLGRTEVRDYIVDSVSSILSSANIAYVKWDMNRHLTEVGSAALPPDRQGEAYHRYVLGLYDVLARITAAFPEVLFESCSGGGGRFDPGMLAYMPQAWTSDNTDASSRIPIQFGTSFVYPASAMGAHVTAVPNHQVGRTTPLDFRGSVAMAGVLGYELDFDALAPEELREIARQVSRYKDLRPVIQFGDLYRLISPFDDASRAALMFVAKDKSEAWVAYYRIRIHPNAQFPVLRLKGLDPEAEYSVTGLPGSYLGDELMSVGLSVDLGLGDYRSCEWRLRTSSAASPQR
jgi:alpha-galactosidase